MGVSFCNFFFNCKEHSIWNPSVHRTKYFNSENNAGLEFGPRYHIKIVLDFYLNQFMPNNLVFTNPGKAKLSIFPVVIGIFYCFEWHEIFSCSDKQFVTFRGKISMVQLDSDCWWTRYSYPGILSTGRCLCC